MNSREALYQRINTHKANPGSAGVRASLQARLHEVGRGSAVDDISLFVDRATEAGAQVFRCGNASEVPALLAEAFASSQHFVLATDPLTISTGLQAALVSADAAREVVTVDGMEGQEDAESAKIHGARMDVGVGAAEAGFADSGAVVIRSSKYESRSLSLLSGVHVALLPANRVYADIYHATELLRTHTGKNGSSAVTLVGGPSKTADIEKVLVTGVHGPGRFIIVLIDNEEETQLPHSY